MKVLFFVHTLSRTRHFRRVIAGLVEQGHTVVLATTGRTEPQKGGKGDYDHPRIQIVACPKDRTDDWAAVADLLRRGRDRLRYLDPRYAHAAKLTERAAAHTPKAWNRALQRHPALARHWRAAQRILALGERLIPCEPSFLQFIQGIAPDLVLVTPLVEFGSYQTDYVKCAHRLGVPVAYLPFSWDNLTNRGLIRVIPDRVLVWNEHQRREAIELHDVPADRVVVTGAPRFDEFFAMRPGSERSEFFGALGLPADRPLVLYLCSSGFVAPREVEFVRQWVSELRRAPQGSWLRDCSILVRPHPAYVDQWESADLTDLPGVALWTLRSPMNGDRRLFDSLYHSSAVVGLNTSAMIEAAIVQRPVYTIRAEEFTGGQSGTIHFHYLLAGNGGVVILAETFEEHVRQLSVALDEREATTHRSRAFLESFVRPRGLDTPASDAMIEEVVRLSAIAKRRQGTPAWHYPLRWALGGAVRLQGERT